MRGPTGDEDSSSASPQDAKFEEGQGVIIGPAAIVGSGETWRRRRGNAGRREIRGNPEIGRAVRREARQPGKPGDRRAGAAGGCGIQGNLENHRPAGWRDEGSGQPGASPLALRKERRFGAHRRFTFRIAGGLWARGNPGPDRRRPWNAGNRGDPETQRASAEGCVIRGNSMIHRRHGFEMREPGAPGAPSES
jgi:hypothetical protein